MMDLIQVIAYEPKPSNSVWNGVAYDEAAIREVLTDVEDLEDFLGRTKGCRLQGRVMSDRSYEIAGLHHDYDFVREFMDIHLRGECPCQQR